MEKQLRELIRARPFRPFLIHTYRKTISVTHPEAIDFTGGRIAIVKTPDERLEVIDLRNFPKFELKYPPAD